MLIGGFLLAVGLLLLTVAADRFVLSAERLSVSLGISPILIGALVVGLGTSAPELLVSLLAALRGELDVAVGNVVGSNTANVTLVIGVAALVTAVGARLRTLAREGVLMMVSVIGLGLVIADLRITRVEGGILIGGMVVAALLLVHWASGEGPDAPDDFSGAAFQAPPRTEAIVGLGALLVTLIGADLLLRGAVRLAAELGISSAFVGLVIVSVGTSLPELATALAAARRGQTDLIVGNVLGSNLFNSLAVAGTAGLAGPGLIDGSFGTATWFMIGSVAAAGIFSLTGRKVVRWEGLTLLSLFVVFVAVAAQ